MNRLSATKPRVARYSRTRGCDRAPLLIEAQACFGAQSGGLHRRRSQAGRACTSRPPGALRGPGLPSIIHRPSAVWPGRQRKRHRPGPGNQTASSKAVGAPSKQGRWPIRLIDTEQVAAIDSKAQPLSGRLGREASKGGRSDLIEASSPQGIRPFFFFVCFFTRHGKHRSRSFHGRQARVTGRPRSATTKAREAPAGQRQPNHTQDLSTNSSVKTPSPSSHPEGTAPSSGCQGDAASTLFPLGRRFGCCASQLRCIRAGDPKSAPCHFGPFPW